MSAYLRLMGTRAGRDVWYDTLTITEFDMVTLGEGWLAAGTRWQGAPVTAV